MHVLVNNHRKSQGLDTLSFNMVIAEQVRIHSYRFGKGLVSTSDPHQGFDDRRKALQNELAFGAIAENLVASYSSAQASFNGWLSSAGHRENIENPIYHLKR